MGAVLYGAPVELLVDGNVFSGVGVSVTRQLSFEHTGVSGGQWRGGC